MLAVLQESRTKLRECIYAWPDTVVHFGVAHTVTYSNLISGKKTAQYNRRGLEDH